MHGNDLKFSLCVIIRFICRSGHMRTYFAKHFFIFVIPNKIEDVFSWFETVMAAKRSEMIAVFPILI